MMLVQGMKEPDEDTVNHPSHYTSGKIEVIDYILDRQLPYTLGNAVKYICRCGKKDRTIQGMITDLEKASFYLHRTVSSDDGGYRFSEPKYDPSDFAEDQRLSYFLGRALVCVSEYPDTGDEWYENQLNEAILWLDRKIALLKQAL